VTNYFGVAKATAFVICAFASGAAASTVNVSADPGQVYVTENGIGSSSVSGASLAGMSVDVTYTDGGAESLTWERALTASGTPSNSHGAATSDGFDLSLGWWEFTLEATRSVSSISMSTLGLGAMFDIYSVGDDHIDTPGTSRGVAMRVIEGDQDGDIGVTFANQVLVRDHMVGNDLFTDMTIDFSDLDAGGFEGRMRFVSDLDEFAVAGDLTPLSVSEVPLPAGLPLLLGGLGVMGLMRRRAKA
jgi:hypothetical protein